MSKISKFVRLVAVDLATNTNWTTDNYPVWYYYSPDGTIRVERHGASWYVRSIRLNDVDIPLNVAHRIKLLVALWKHKNLHRRQDKIEKKERAIRQLEKARETLTSALLAFENEHD